MKIKNMRVTLVFQLVHKPAAAAVFVKNPSKSFNIEELILAAEVFSNGRELLKG